IGPHAGDVIDLGLFQFTLNEIGAWVQADQSSGRIIHVPNGKVFTDPVANYNKGFRYIWNEVPVVVTFESDWRKAKQILGKIAVKHAEHLTAQAEQELLAASQQYLINYRKLTPIVYTSVVDYGVQLTIRYLIEPRKRRGTEHAIWEDILTEFAAAPDIALAYHTPRDDHELPFAHPHLAVAELEQQPALHDEKQLVLQLVMMPHELAFDLDELDVAVVELAHDLRAPVLVELPEFLGQVHATHARRPPHGLVPPFPSAC